MRSTRTVIGILLLSCSIGIRAQDNKQLIFQQVTEKDGLSNSIVNAVTKDREGFMWIGTFDGLSRYDGTHFITFRSNRNQLHSLSYNSVHGVCVDNDDNIWCATQSGISCFRKKKQQFENYFPEPPGSNASFSDILCDAKGNIWCSGNLGLYRFLPAKNAFIRCNTDNQLPGTHVHKRGIVLSPDGKGIWLATQKGINYYDFAADQFYNYKNNPAKLAVFDSLTHYPLTIDRQGKLLYGRERPDRIMEYNPATNVVTALGILFSQRKNGTAPPSYIFVDKDNRYWISTWGYTPFLYDPATKQMHEFYQDKDVPFSIGGDFFWHAMQDDDGTLWLGTVNGLSYINTDLNFYHVYEPLKNAGAALQHRAINRYFEDSKGNWWFTCYDIYDLHQYNPATGKLRIFSLPPKEFGIRGFNQVGDYLLVNTNTGIRGFNTVTGKPEDIPGFSALKKLIGEQPVYWLRKINDSIVCVLTEQSGLIQYNIGTTTYKRIALEESSFLKRNIYNSRSVVVANGNQLYLAFTPLKLARYDLTANRLDSLPISVPDNVLLLEGPTMSMKADQHGNLWIALKETGLIRYNIEAKETSLWQQSDGLVFNQVFDLVFDSSGKAWIAAYNKFSVFDSSRNSFENFTLPISENTFAYGSRLLRLNNGNILGNIDKTFIEWLPAKFARNTTDHRVLINRLIVHDSSVWVSQSDAISLSHANNNIVIEFGLLTGLTKNRYILEYKLDGFDEKWIQAGPLNTAVYNSLPEKKFIFRVRAVSADRSWTGKETTLTIRIVPPFYRTGLFRIVAIVLLVAIIAWLIRLRINNVRKTEKRNSALNRMISGWRLKALRAQMNPHFIFNCMNSIDLYILKNDAENASRYLNKFAKLVRLILSQSDEMYVPLNKELEMLEYYIELEKLRFEHPFSHSIKIKNDIDAGDIEIPSMLLQPYVENAILHGLRHKQGQGHLSICIQRKENTLNCVIEDNGIGRKSSHEINQSGSYYHDSKGSVMTAERLALLNVSADKSEIDIIDLEDEQGRPAGTRVQISIPFEFGY
jgi:ligand-binding sensor domain-containing protein